MQFFAGENPAFVRFRRSKAPSRRKRDGAGMSGSVLRALFFYGFFPTRQQLSMQSAAALAPPEERKLSAILRAFSR